MQRLQFTVYSKISLTKHQKSIHMGKKYLCNLCTYQAPRKDHLQKHKNTVHMCNVVLTE